MTIDELLDIMDETLEEATTLPFTGGKRMVDVEKVRDIMDDIRLSMPQEIKQARAIVEDRGRIVDDANKEAEAIIKRAEERARAIVAEQAIVKGRPAEGHGDAGKRPGPKPRDARHRHRLLREHAAPHGRAACSKPDRCENGAHHPAPNLEKRALPKSASRAVRTEG